MSETNDNNGRSVDGQPTIGITGAAGFLGSKVLALFQREHPEWDLVAIDNQFRGQVSSVGNVDIEHVDVRNRDRLETTLEGSDVVLHLAAVSGVDDCEANPDLAYEVNVTGTNNVAWFCRKTGAALVFPFSMAVLGDPESFPITADLPMDPMNWYGRTKYLGKQAVKAFAERSFPAHLLLKSNLYGEHVVGDTVVTKPTVINFFVDRALAGEPLTVYEPGSQARNFLHVTDAAGVYLSSTERLLDALDRGETGTETYEVASDADHSVQEVADIVATLAKEELGDEIEVSLVENPRKDTETLVEEFTVDTSRTRDSLGWTASRSMRGAIRESLRRHG